MNIKRITGHARENTERPRCYYIPFSEQQQFCFKHGIIDRGKSDRFISLDGEWGIEEYSSPECVDVDREPKDRITVPSCVEIFGYGKIQYVNIKYPFPFDPPRVPHENPTYHYRRVFNIETLEDEYYLNFEGVDSAFFLYVNGHYAGYGNIPHSTNEFRITELLRLGENRIDVIVVKWSAGSYLEDQDKFRWTGIFRSVYLLKRPKEHITDYKIETDICDGKGCITVRNLSFVDIRINIPDISYSDTVKVGDETKVTIASPKLWTAESPMLYDIVLSSNGEKILERAGIRSVSIENGVFKLNGKHVKLKGINRHESSPDTGATVTLEDTVKDLELMKFANINAIRTSHYPDNNEFYDLCNVYGFYVMDEADVECHGTSATEAGEPLELFRKYADSEVYSEGVFNREVNLYERDKNRTCVIIWSLGNESGYGKMFFEGCDYIKARDKRPIHYEGLTTVNDSERYTTRIDIYSRMYPSVSSFDEFLKDEKETRPYVLCEYSHAMGNSNGDLNDYWKEIDKSDRFMGGFVWEWCDHAVRKGDRFLYGGDHGETLHDGNFCVDGLVTPDRKIKSNLLELKAVYGGKREYGTFLPDAHLEALDSDRMVNTNIKKPDTIKTIDGIPLHINIFRASIDNDINAKKEWTRFFGCSQVIDRVTDTHNKTTYEGRIVKASYPPIMCFTVTLERYENSFDLSLEYKIADFVKYLPRVGFELTLPKEYARVGYDGYGPTESYVDKHMASEYGHYETNAYDNYSDNIRPQECGSHFGCNKLTVHKLYRITAEKLFSFSVLPHSTETIEKAEHSFELPKSNAVYLNLDIHMCGIGSASCGPDLSVKYLPPKHGKNTFRFVKI